MSGRALYIICLALTGSRPPLLADKYACSITRKAALRIVIELYRVNAYSRRDRLIRCLRFSDFASRVEQEAGGKNKPVVVYCASSHCNSSEKAAEKLEVAGFTAVSRYTGGAAAWQEDAAEKSACQASSC